MAQARTRLSLSSRVRWAETRQGAGSGGIAGTSALVRGSHTSRIALLRDRRAGGLRGRRARGQRLGQVVDRLATDRDALEVGLDPGADLAEDTAAHAAHSAHAAAFAEVVVDLPGGDV